MPKSPRREHARAANEAAVALVRQVVEVARSDTVYRDLYLRRAGELLAGPLPAEEYRAFKARQREIEQLLRDSREAVRERDWSRVRDLSAGIEPLRRLVEARGAEIALGDEVYGTPHVFLDPFSPGYELLLNDRGLDAAALRDGLIGQLAALEHDDAPWAAFYAARRAYFARLAVRETPGAHQAAVDPWQVEREALEAVDRGEVGRLRKIADDMLRQQRAHPSVAADETLAAALHRGPDELSIPFPAEAVQPAGDLGLAHIRLEVALHTPPQAVELMFRTDAVERDLRARSETSPDLRAGKSDVLLKGLAHEPEAALEVSGPLREFVERMAHHPFINSGGARYLPPLGAEWVLIEDFPEGEDAPRSALLAALGFERRRALSRAEIESALLHRGTEIVEHRLGLDPRECRLVCVPADVYSRAGARQGWGQREQWTHFDGYQVLDNLSLRALVGGDVRYGGLADLVAISPTDRREGVVARFAVVRRARLVARWR